MTANRDLLSEYVKRVSDETMRFAQDLLSEHEQLAALLARLQADARSGNERRAAGREDQGDASGPRRGLGSTVRQLEEGCRRLRSELERLEERNFKMVNLYAASVRLLGALDRRTVLETIQEIATNLVGCEEIAIVEKDPRDGRLRLALACGVKAEDYEGPNLERGIIGYVARMGTAVVGEAPPGVDRAPGEGRLTACLPLSAGPRIFGAVALFRLLPQKPGLESIDHELLDLLSEHGGLALDRCWQQEAMSELPART